MSVKKVIKGTPRNSGSPLGPPPAGQGRPSAPSFSSSGKVLQKGIPEARNQAQEIIQRAYVEAERIRNEAEAYRQRGYEEGYAEGLDRGRAELTESILQMNRHIENEFRYIEPDLVQLSLRIAEKIIAKKVEVDRGIVTQIVSKALDSVRHQREIFLRVNPADYEMIVAEKASLLDRLSRAQDIDIRSDPAIKQGGCQIESELGTIEATLEKQLAAIEKILLGD